MNKKYTISKILDDEWHKIINDFEPQPIYQSPAFLKTNFNDNNKEIIFIKILDSFNNCIGITAVLIIKYLNLIKIFKINRGPIFLKNSNISKNEKEIIINNLFNYLSNKFYGIKIYYISPEIKNIDNNNDLLTKFGFIKLRRYFGSSILNISLDTEILLNNLDSKWRNLLRKGIKNYPDKYTILTSRKDIESFISHYIIFAKKNNFKTRDENYFYQLILNNPYIYIFSNNNFNNSEKIEGAIVIFISGQTSTYFLGINNEIARKKCLNYYLLWEAILFSKKLGCNYFDLGGLTNNTPKGIQHFKKGLNGVEFNNICDRFKIKLF
jgi:hypothetical protein